MNPLPDISDTVHRMKRKGDAFAVATVVRTLSVTAAKPGAKAILNQQGELVEGWIGGGCARRAVAAAAVRSIAEGEPRFVSVHPDEALTAQGMVAGEEIDGRWVAASLCPSRGSMEIFVEPFLANPELIVAGTSPVAASVCQLASLFGFSVVQITGGRVDESHGGEYQHREHWGEVAVEHSHRYIVVATQGTGDLQALAGALAIQCRHASFVGSHRKMAHLKKRLAEQSHDAIALERIKGPAGLDIGAVTPHEIALSILAELVQIRRQERP